MICIPQQGGTIAARRTGQVNDKRVHAMRSGAQRPNMVAQRQFESRWVHGRIGPTHVMLVSVTRRRGLHRRRLRVFILVLRHSCGSVFINIVNFIRPLFTKNKSRPAMNNVELECIKDEKRRENQRSPVSGRTPFAKKILTLSLAKPLRCSIR